MSGGLTRVVLADYGAGNLRSIASALARAGADPVVSVRAADVREAPLAVIAGVGHVESAARGLAVHGLDVALQERADAGRPVFGICVGLQLLFGRSEEGGSGLGLLPGETRRVVAPRVPHMGWNRLQVVGDGTLLDGLDGTDVYFAHSYAVAPAGAAAEVVTAVTEHGGPIVAAVERGPVAGVQFHPERSGPAGARLLTNLLVWAAAGVVG